MTKWKKARKRPIWIEYREVEGDVETIKTREGTLKAYAGQDFIIKGVKGELYPINKGVFWETYEVIS